MVSYFLCLLKKIISVLLRFWVLLTLYSFLGLSLPHFGLQAPLLHRWLLNLYSAQAALEFQSLIIQVLTGCFNLDGAQTSQIQHVPIEFILLTCFSLLLVFLCHLRPWVFCWTFLLLIPLFSLFRWWIEFLIWVIQFSCGKTPV